MNTEYKVVEVFTREGARWHHLQLHEAVVKLVRDRKMAARVLVLRGIGGAFEGGETVSQRIVDLSSDMPIKIEVILPAAALEELLPALKEMVRDGVIAVRDSSVVLHRTSKRPSPRHLRVRDVMTADPLVVAPHTPVRDVVHLIAEHEFNAVPIVEDGRVTGIISQGDLLSRAGMPLRIALFAEYDRLERERLLPSGSRPACEIMTSPAVVVAADCSLEDAIEIMVERGLKRLPAVDQDGLLQGMLSRIDVLNALAGHAQERRFADPCRMKMPGWCLVGDAPLHDIPVVDPDATLAEVLDLFDGRSQRVAVVDTQGRMVGLISDRDLLSAFEKRDEGLVEYVLRFLSGRVATAESRYERALQAVSARDVMRVDPVTVREDEPIESALALLTAHRLKRLPVVAAGGRFVGVLSRDAVVRTGLLLTELPRGEGECGPLAARDEE